MLCPTFNRRFGPSREVTGRQIVAVKTAGVRTEDFSARGGGGNLRAALLTGRHRLPTLPATWG
jgi:hypothetical protein